MSLRALQSLKDIGPQIQWLHSYVTEDSNARDELASHRAHSVATRIADRVAANCRSQLSVWAWHEGLPAVVEELGHRWGADADAPLGDEEPSC